MALQSSRMQLDVALEPEAALEPEVVHGVTLEPEVVHGVALEPEAVHGVALEPEAVPVLVCTWAFGTAAVCPEAQPA